MDGMTTNKVEDQPQTSMDDITVEDDDIEKFLKDFIDTGDAFNTSRKDHEANKSKLAELVDREGWKIGQTIRCKQFMLTITEAESVHVPAHDRSGGRRLKVKEAL